MTVTKPVHRSHRVLASLNCDGLQALWLLLGCGLLLIAEFGGEAARLALRYERDAVAAGEIWRWFTAHFVHLNLEHALLNALGFVLMWALFRRDYTLRAWLLIVLTAIAAIGAGLWFRDSTVQWYVGSSGVLHGLMAAGTLAHLRRREADGWVLAAFLVGKLIYEQVAGALPLTDESVPVVVNAHLYGAIGGLAAALPLTRRPEPV